MYAFIGLLMVVLIGIGGGYWAIKKIRDKNNQEFIYKWQSTLVKENVDAEEFKNAVLTDFTVDETIKDLKLLERWGMSDPEAAKEQIRNKFLVTINGQSVMVTYQDKDKALSQEILKSLLLSFERKQSVSRELRSGY